MPTTPMSAVLPAIAFLLVGLGALTGPRMLSAQTPDQGQTADAQWEVTPRLWAGGGLMVAQPLGEFSEYVNVGVGIGGFFRGALDEQGILSLRADVGFMTYGRETRRVPLSETVGGLIQVDLTTSNNIVVVGVGPEVAIPVGPARLYGTGSAGYTYFHTDSRVEGTQDQEALFRTRNHSDGGFAWNGGGGLQVQVSGGRTPVLVDLGATYHANGRREYLTREGIVDDGEGDFQLIPTRSDADFLVWRLGVSVGLRATQP